MSGPVPVHAELGWLPAVELARLVRDGQVSARELVQAAIDRLAATAELNVVAFERFELALEEATSPGLPDGPFTGVPILLKDLGCEVEGLGISMGSSLIRDAALVARSDAHLVTRLKQAGFIVIGTTTTPEFGIRSSTESRAFGLTRNPWGLERSTGGSSGGSAAAVAAGVVPVAQGSDGAGSLRMPAALCGISTLKPSHGLISQAPDWEVMMGHSDYGPLARHLVDIAAFLDVTAGSTPGELAVHGPESGGSFAAGLEGEGSGRRLRIGVFDQPSLAGVPIDEGVVAAVRRAARSLESMGHDVDEDWPEAYDDEEYLDHFIDAIAPTLVDLLDGLEAQLGVHIDPATDVEPVTRYWYERGRGRTAGQLAGDLRWLGEFRRRMASWWDRGWDLLVAPSFPRSTHVLGTAEDGGPATRENINLIRTTAPFNTTGQPALSVPAVLTSAGPVGVQLVAAPGRDRELLRLGHLLEQVTGAASWRPPRFQD